MVYKQAYFNPAPWSDDVLNAYTQLKLVMEQKRRKQAEASQVEKQAGVMDTLDIFYNGMLDTIAGKVVNVINNPRVLADPKVMALASAGIAASAYAPKWAGGPGEKEDKFSVKRMAKNAILYNIVGSSVLRVPEAAQHAFTSAESGNVLGVVSNTARMAPAAGLGYGIAKEMRKEEPSGREVLKPYLKGSKVNLATNIPIAVYRLSQAGVI